jgi:hypothetical protein
VSDTVSIVLTKDEALVLVEFFGRFDDTNDFTLRHTAEFIAFCRIAGQLERALVEPFLENYTELLQAARNRLSAEFEGDAPGVNYDPLSKD